MTVTETRAELATLLLEALQYGVDREELAAMLVEMAGIMQIAANARAELEKIEQSDP